MSREDMAVGKDPAIKLFGRTIFVPDAHTSEDTESLDTGSTLMKKPKTEECKQEHLGTADKVASFTCSRPPDLSQDTTSKSGTHREDSHGDEGAETKPPHFKRPDTILPCPRCNSPDTKFCYFNNYNVNQPRHFCKSCQRYWTAGGTVRNVPVGAGRRRNKQLASQYRQIIASSDVDVGPASVLEMPDPTTNREQQVLEESSSSCTTSGLSISLAGQDPSSPNETVLKFGPGSPPCDEKASLPPPCGSRLMNSTLAQNCLQFVPGSYWNCIPVWVAGAGNMSLALANGCVSAPIFGSENGLQVLGKHPRDANAVNEEVVKTLRIHSVDRAA